MRIRRSTPYGAGIYRRRRGRGFSFADEDGTRVHDAQVLARIRQLAIPPAWRKVWICPYAHGHIQAVGTDAAGRRQYLYHERWRRERDEEKHDRVLAMAARLPQLREQIASDIRSAGWSRERAAAVAIGLLDRGLFRVGGEEYAQENGTYGVATLLRRHIQIGGATMRFDFRAKGGLRRRVQITDPRLADALRTPGPATKAERLLAYDSGGVRHDLHADDINQRFKELAGADCSAKDLRTWHATVLAAAAFAAYGRAPRTARARRATEHKVVAEVAVALGNTPAVARSSYIDPRVIQVWKQGRTIAAALRRARAQDGDDERRDITEKAVLRLLRAHRT